MDGCEEYPDFHEMRDMQTQIFVLVILGPLIRTAEASDSGTRPVSRSAVPPPRGAGPPAPGR